MEKSDKKSIVIAFIFLIILIGCLGFVVYIKMTYDLKDNSVNNDTNIVDTPITLSLDNIISNFNSSQLVSNYYALGTVVTMEKTNTGFNVTYSSDQETDIIEGTYEEYIISIKFNNDNMEIANNIFKELVNISCKNNGYNDGECDKTVDEFLNNSYDVDGLIFEKKSDTEIYLRIDTTKKINLFVSQEIYKSGDLIDITSNNYIIEDDNYKLSNSNFTYDSNNNTLTYKATVENSGEKNNYIKIKLKLYNENKNLIMTNENNINMAGDKDKFEVLFNITLDNTINYNDIKYLSVSFVNE